MTSKSKIRTNLVNGTRFLQNRKTLSTIGFSTIKAAQRNAVKYEQMLNQTVTVVEVVRPCPGGTWAVFELAVENYIG